MKQWGVEGRTVSPDSTVTVKTPAPRKTKFFPQQKTRLPKERHRTYFWHLLQQASKMSPSTVFTKRKLTEWATTTEYALSKNIKFLHKHTITVLAFIHRSKVTMATNTSCTVPGNWLRRGERDIRKSGWLDTHARARARVLCTSAHIHRETKELIHTHTRARAYYVRVHTYTERRRNWYTRARAHARTRAYYVQVHTYTERRRNWYTHTRARVLCTSAHIHRETKELIQYGINM